MLPELLDIIWDYYYSIVMWERKQRLHRELKHAYMLQEMKVFYNVFHTITITVHEQTETVHTTNEDSN